MKAIRMLFIEYTFLPVLKGLWHVKPVEDYFANMI